LLRKGKGLLALGKKGEADEYFHEAYREAKSLGSLRSMLPILATRYQFALEAGDEDDSVDLRKEGRELIAMLEEKLDEPALREKFRHTADVRVFFD
jgi:hypothetical protein